MSNKSQKTKYNPLDPSRFGYSNIPCSRPTRDAIKAEARAKGMFLYFYCEEILKKHLELGKADPQLKLPLEIEDKSKATIE